VQTQESLNFPGRSIGQGDEKNHDNAHDEAPLCEKIKEHIRDFHVFESDIAQDLDKRDYIVSNEKIESTGYKPDHSLQMGIQELIRGYEIIRQNQYSNI